MRTAALVCLVAALGATLAMANRRPTASGFQPDHTYVYRLDTQVASKLLGETPEEIQQQAASRLRADLQLRFSSSERHVHAQLRHVQLADLNAELPPTHRIQPLERFERHELPAQLKKALELPFTLVYVDGVVERINFHVEDSVWSKNVKRAALNMLQLNLKRNNIQTSELEIPSEETKSPLVFHVPEMTLEGECEVAYTIDKQAKSEEPRLFNVTKATNFERCTRTAELSFGYGVQPAQQLRCLQCMKRAGPSAASAAKQTVCMHECRSYDVAPIERSTVARVQLFGNTERFAVQRVALVSQYVLKTGGARAQIVSNAELELREVRANSEKPAAFKKAAKDETLMYSAEWDLKEKQFYMFGDDALDTTADKNIFASEEKKQQQAAHFMRSILKAWTDKTLGYELDSALQFNELVVIIRQCRLNELERLISHLEKIGAEHGDRAIEQTKALLVDALAVAGTHNSLSLLAGQISGKKIESGKAVEALQLFLLNQHSPSDQQADILSRLCHTEIVRASPALRQTCWLSFGAAVGKICQDLPVSQKSRSLLPHERLCPSGKKEQYKKLLIERLNKADNLYERLLAIKCIGNSALDVCLPTLEKLIGDQSEPRLIRMEAVDALRRLRTSMPHKLQQLLLPLFQNQREQPELRMAAFAMLMHTQPEHALLDQLVFAVRSERSQQVQSFVLTALDALAASPCHVEQKTAQHLQTALQSVRAALPEEQLRASRFYRVPIYVANDEKSVAGEQSLFMGLASIVSPTSALPVQLAASIRSALSGEAVDERVRLSFTQKHLEQWYEKLVAFYDKYANQEWDQHRAAKELRTIYSSLGIKSRRSGSYYISSNEEEEFNSKSIKGEGEKPFGMIVLRSNDVDNFLVPIEEESMPEMLQKMLRGEKPSLAGWKEWLGRLSAGKSFHYHLGLTVGEQKNKLATSAGLPVAVWWQTTALFGAEGSIRLTPEESSAQLRLRTSGIVSHLFKTECWTPVGTSGVESVRTIEFTTPVEFEARREAGEYKLIVRPPQEQSRRLFGFHSLPLCYTRAFDMTTRLYREPRVVSVRNYALEHTQRDFHHGSQSKPIRVQGHLHWISQFEQIPTVLFTTENNVHIYYQPSSQTPKEIVIRVSGHNFERVSKPSKPQLSDFYAKGFDSVEFEDLSLEKDEQRQTKLAKFVSEYSPAHAYKHALKLTVEARCAARTHKMSAELKAECDSRMQHCQTYLELERSPLAHESSPWTLKARLQTIAPALLSRSHSTYAEHQQRALAELTCRWGSSNSQKLHLRIQAEPTKRTATWMSIRSDSSEETTSEWSRILNKIDLIAEYELSPRTRAVCSRIYDMIKSKLFWNIASESEKEYEKEYLGESGIVRATVIVDPLTRRHMNVSVKTPSEKVRFESIRVPVRVPMFGLDRRPTNIHSVGQLVEQFATVGKTAECRVSSERVRTFDGVAYKAPWSSCWSVLAKDCAREQPRFAVLLKKTSDEQKIKILTPERIIELATCESGICVRVNGEPVRAAEKLAAEGIQMVGGERVYVNVRDVQVNFDGSNCQIKLSPIYKNTQCGLCGHYSDEEDNVFRGSDNQRARSLKEFHRSYTLKNEECSEKSLNSFYSENNSNEFIVKKPIFKSNENVFEDSEETIFEDMKMKNSESSEEIYKTGQKINPIERTAVREYQHKICFSMDNVKQCPKGSEAVESESIKETKVKFACVSRSSVQARRLMRELRKNNVVDMSEFTHSYSEAIQQPSQCISVY